VNYSDINDIFRAMGKKKLNGSGIVQLPVHCINEMKLVEMNYDAEHNVVTGIYRCEEDEMYQELQLAIYLEPRSVPQEDSCRIGSFLKAWNIPVGEATRFSQP